MKKGKYLLLLFVLIPFFKINASGSVTVSTSSLSIDEGSSKTFTINANNAAGRIDISSSSSSVAAISKSSVFLDNNSVTITVKGKSPGIVNISVKMTDVATYDGDVISGTKLINATINKVKNDTPVKKEPKKMSIQRFEIVGYPINFEVNKQEYTIDVSDKVNDLYIILEGSNFVATGDKDVKIKDKKEIKVSLKDEIETKDYTIKINRISNKNQDKNDKKNVSVQYIENDINKILVGFSLFFGLLSIVLSVIVLKIKPRQAPKIEPDYKRDLLNLNPNLGTDHFSENKPPQKVESNWKDSPFNENRDNERKFVDDDSFSDVNENLQNNNSVIENSLPKTNIINIEDTSEVDNNNIIN